MLLRILNVQDHHPQERMGRLTVPIVWRLRNPGLEEVGTSNLEFWKAAISRDGTFYSLILQ